MNSTDRAGTIRPVLTLAFALILMVWTFTGQHLLAFILSLAIAGFALLHTTRLERRIRHEQANSAHAAADLQRLSTRLVDAQEAERRAVARELHDEVGQALTAIKMELSRAERARLPEPAAGAVESARAATDEALRTVRDLSRLLHPRVLDELGLGPALEACVREFGRRTGIRSEFLTDGACGHADTRVEICAYRIVQEALTNVARHAEATSCRVTLERLPGALRVSVEDDGRGFDPAAVAEGCLGLLGIRERVASCGATCSMQTAPGQGTMLTVALPALGPAAGAGTLAVTG